MKKILKSKKGMSSLELIIGMLIFITTVAFVADLMVLSWQMIAVSQANTQVARIAGYQGGILNEAPDGFPGHYYTRSNMTAAIEDRMRNAGIDEFTVSSVQWGEIGYREKFTTSIEFTYKWELISQLIPVAEVEQTMKSERPAISEWKYDYDTWDGE